MRWADMWRVEASDGATGRRAVRPAELSQLSARPLHHWVVHNRHGGHSDR